MSKLEDLENNTKKYATLKCSKCKQPLTFPFVVYKEDGIGRYAHYDCYGKMNKKE